MTSKIERKRQITIETHSITRIRIRSKSHFIFCRVCHSENIAFTSEQVAAFFQTNADEISRQIELGKFHLIDGKETALICGSVFEE